ncbi:MAG: AAA family ATPase [Thermaerobacter sp.]|nr:AAA family ATPase [Thermaerobacter sp.]
MKVAITGKGGVGKTTLAAALALQLAERGWQVTAVDADPDANLGAALGFPPELVRDIVPLGAMRELVAERTGAQPGSMGGYFKLNPLVEDLPEKLGVVHRGVRLLVMGGLKKGGTGCICPENAVLRALTSHLVLRAHEAVILDMEAGIEHMTRGTGRGVDAFVVVVEPGGRSVGTAETIRDLAADLGIEKVWAVGSKVRGEEDREFLTQAMPWAEFLGMVPYDPAAMEADRERRALVDLPGPAQAAYAEILERLLSLQGKG